MYLLLDLEILTTLDRRGFFEKIRVKKRPISLCFLKLLFTIIFYHHGQKVLSRMNGHKVIL